MNPLTFIFPAVLDTVANCLNFIGLMKITASNFQILQGFELLFVIILSNIILKRNYKWIQWFALATVIGGLFVFPSIKKTVTEDEGG